MTHPVRIKFLTLFTVPPPGDAETGLMIKPMIDRRVAVPPEYFRRFGTARINYTGALSRRWPIACRLIVTIADYAVIRPVEGEPG